MKYEYTEPLFSTGYQNIYLTSYNYEALDEYEITVYGSSGDIHDIEVYTSELSFENFGLTSEFSIFIKMEEGINFND